MMVRRRVVSINDRVAHRLVRIGHLHLGTDTPARSLRKAFSHGFEPVRFSSTVASRRSDAMPWKTIKCESCQLSMCAGAARTWLGKMAVSHPYRRHMLCLTESGPQKKHAVDQNNLTCGICETERHQVSEGLR